MTFNEFGFMSQNPVVCPISHSLVDVETSATTPTIRAADFNAEDGSFLLYTDDQSLYDPLPTTERYKVTAQFTTLTSGDVQAEHQISITYTGCLQEDPIVPNDPFDVAYEILEQSHASLIGLTQGDAVLELQIDFPTSSRPDDCPLIEYEIIPDPNGDHPGWDVFITLVITLDPLTRILRVAPDESVEAADLMGQTYEIQVKGRNTDQAFADVTPALIHVNFIGCAEADTTGCASCDRELFEVVDTINSDYIWSSTRGCTACRYGWEQELYESVTSGGDPQIIRGCILRTDYRYREDLNEGEQCSWGAVLAPESEPDDALVCKACSELIPGCALCTSHTECLECMDSTEDVITLRDVASGEETDLCTSSDLCYNPNGGIGVKYCDLCIDNCIACSRADPTATCYQCENEYSYDSDTNTCVLLSTPSGTLEVEYFVNGFEGVLMPTTDINSQADETKIDGSSIGEAFNFIQQTIHHVYTYQDPASKESVTATVWLSKGHHFFFTCSKDLHGATEGFYNQVDDSMITLFCDELDALSALYPTTDNVNFEFKPMKCSHKSTFTLSAADALTFDDICVDDNDSNWSPDSGPVINVLDSNSYFNITRSAVFEDIYFRGEHALAQATDKTVSPAYVPAKKCTVNVEPTGEYDPIDLTAADASTLGGLAVTCGDSAFNDVSIPMQDEETCESTPQTSRQSVRGCRGEPYHADFFTEDSESGMYYKRHQVLFNLYNFDGISSSTPDNVTTLTLKNCTFSYFLADYEALIYVENNNFAPMGVDEAGLASFYALLGSDKGAVLQINKSTFSHSRFCKGMIVSKARPDLGFFTPTGSLIIDLDAQYEGIALSVEPMINVTESEFINLNWGHAVQYLSLEGVGDLTVTNNPGVTYPPFDNHGSVMNLQGFAGKVSMFDSEVKTNFVFIPDMYPSKRAANEPEELLSQYFNSDYNQYKTTRCNDEGKVVRLFSNFLTSVKEHPDELLAQLEKYSPIYISNGRDPVIFRETVFANNTGIFGGAICVDNPDFAFDDAATVTYNSAAFRPYVILWESTFEQNSAYASGNAIYVRSTRARRGISEFEQQRVCGQLHAEQSTFRFNKAIMKSHNGGAIAISCDFVSPADPRYTGRTSDYRYSNYDRLEAVSDVATTEQLGVYRQASGIRNSTFIGNTAGQKGTAIYARQVSNVIVKWNRFEENEPHYTYLDSVQSPYPDTENRKAPYYMYLAKQARSISFHESKELNVNEYSSAYVRAVGRSVSRTVEDEFQYMQLLADTYENGGLVDMPQTQGAVYVESCSKCLVSYEKTDSGCNFCYGLRQQLEITGNEFVDNQVGISFYEAHTLPKASQIYVKGGILNDIRENIFREIVSTYWVKVWQDMPSYNITMPDSYYRNQEAPLIRVEIPEGYGRFIDLTKYHELDDDTFENTPVGRGSLPDPNLDEEDEWPEWICGESCYNFTSFSNTTFEKNFFIGIHSVSPFISAQVYKGSLIQFESGTRHARLSLIENEFEDNFVTGHTDTGLIYAYGGAVTADANIFTRCGHFNTTFISNIQSDTKEYGSYTLQQNDAEDDDSEVDIDEIFRPDYFPINTNRNVTQKYTQVNGMLILEGGPMSEKSNASKPILHSFTDNVFNFIFCQKGCVYQQYINDMSEPSYLNFTGNNYRNIFAEEAAIMLTQVAPQSNEHLIGYNNTYAVQNFTFEEFVNIQNGAFATKGRNYEVAQLFSNVFFDNIFSSAISPTISVEKGAFFNCYNCTFMEGSKQDRKILNVEEEFEMANFLWLITNREVLSDYVSQSALNTTFMPFQPGSKGAIMLKNMAKQKENGTTVTDFLGRRLSHNSLEADVADPDPNSSSYGVNPLNITFTYEDAIMNLADFMIDTYGGMSQYPTSVIKESKFENLIGEDAGVFYLEKSSLILANSTLMNNEAKATGSSNIVVVGSYLNVTECYFDGNQAVQGGVFYAKGESHVEIEGSEFFQNYASEQAGVIMADSNSKVMIYASIFEENSAAAHGSVLVATNINQNMIMIESCKFTFNQAGFSMMSLVNTDIEIYDSVFEDNVAVSVTNGFAMTNSKLTASGVQIFSTSRTFPIDQTAVLAGFFYLSQRSQLNLIGDSVIQHIHGRVATAILLQAESKLFIQDAQFIDILALEVDGFEASGVIVGWQSESIVIDQSTFSGNQNTNVFSDRTSVTITNSVFKHGQMSPYVTVYGATLTMQSSSMMDAGDPFALQLSRRLAVAKDTRQQGRGVQCYHCKRVTLFNNEFTNMQAVRGGALFLDFSTNVKLEKNSFVNNTAQQGGAVYIYHSQVNIIDNHFEGNQAINGNTIGVAQVVSVQHEGSGGAIFFTCVDVTDDSAVYLGDADHEEDHEDHDDHSECSVELSENRFWDNLATNKGGALMWTNRNFTITDEESNDFQDNTATTGNKISSPPARIRIEVIESDNAKIDPFPPIYDPDDSDNFLDQDIAQKLQAAFIIVSGQSFSIKVTIYDDDGHVYADDSTSTAKIEFIEGLPEFGDIRGNQAIAGNGIYLFDTLRIIMRPESKNYLKLSIFNLPSYGNQQTFLQEPVVMEFTTRECIHGEKFTEERTCEKCPIGFYSYTISREPYECLPCPRFAVCPGENVMVPKAGYVRMHESSIIFIRCFLEKACILGEKTAPLGTCHEGYQGIMCASCDDGLWKRTNTFKCSECTNTGLKANIFLLVQWVIFMIFMLFLVKLFQRNFPRVRQEAIPIFRIFFNYYHFLSILSKLEDIEVSSPAANTFINYIDNKLFFTTPVEWLMDISCIKTGDLTPEQKYYVMLVLHAIMPIVIFLINGFMWLIGTLCCKYRNHSNLGLNMNRFWNRVIASTGMCMFMVYPNMIEFFLSSVKCFKSLEEAEGEIQVSRLRTLPTIECYKGQHLVYWSFVTIPALSLWLVGFPAFVIYKMNRKSNVISNSNVRCSDLLVAERQQVNNVKSQFGFFYVGLKIQFDDDLEDQEKEEKKYEDQFMNRHFSKKQLTFLETVKRYQRLITAPISGQGVKVDMGDRQSTRSFFYWEFLVFVQKVILYIIVIFYTEINQGLQANAALFCVAIFFFIQLYNKPYEKKLLNNLHTWGLGVLLMVIYCRIVIKSFGISHNQANLQNVLRGEETVSEEISQIERSHSFYDWRHEMGIVFIVFAVILVTLILDIYFTYSLYIHFLIFLVENRHLKQYRWCTFGLWKLEQFRDQHCRQEDINDTDDEDDFMTDHHHGHSKKNIDNEAEDDNDSVPHYTESSDGSESLSTNRANNRDLASESSDQKGQWMDDQRPHNLGQSRNKSILRKGMTSIVSVNQIDVVQDDNIEFMPRNEESDVESREGNNYTSRSSIQSTARKFVSTKVFPMGMGGGTGEGVYEVGPSNSNTQSRVEEQKEPKLLINDKHVMPTSKSQPRFKHINVSKQVDSSDNDEEAEYVQRKSAKPSDQIKFQRNKDSFDDSDSFGDENDSSSYEVSAKQVNAKQRNKQKKPKKKKSASPKADKEMQTKPSPNLQKKKATHEKSKKHKPEISQISEENSSESSHNPIARSSMYADQQPQTIFNNLFVTHKQRDRTDTQTTARFVEPRSRQGTITDHKQNKKSKHTTPEMIVEHSQSERSQSNIAQSKQSQSKPAIGKGIFDKKRAASANEKDMKKKQRQNAASLNQWKDADHVVADSAEKAAKRNKNRQDKGRMIEPQDRNQSRKNTHHNEKMKVRGRRKDKSPDSSDGI